MTNIETTATSSSTVPALSCVHTKGLAIMSNKNTEAPINVTERTKLYTLLSTIVEKAMASKAAMLTTSDTRASGIK